MRGRGERVFGQSRLSGGGSSVLGMRGRARGVTVSSVMSSLSTSEASPFLHAFSLFNWGEFRTSDGIYIHSVGIMLGVRGKMGLGSDSSFLKGKDVHFLGVEDLCLIHPSFNCGGDSSHGEDHRGDLLV